jgi:GNAT superfamily N-acetyltransferase
VSTAIIVRPVQEADFTAWLPLWNAYNAFYGRKDETALDRKITQSTWGRFLDPSEPVFALVAESAQKLIGLTHYLFHRDTTRIELTCYLQDLFTAPAERDRGIATSLIRAVYEQARAAGTHSVYWQTHESNAIGRRLYDKLAKHSGFLVYEQEL